MIPLRDENPAHRSPVVTVMLIAACVGAFLWVLSLEGYDAPWVYQTLGTVPSVLLGRSTIQPYFEGFAPVASVVTALFLHAGFLHLAGNMLFLWVFGNNVEDRLGHGRFLVFYLASGVAASLAHVALFPDSTVPVVGASGAVSGVLGAYLLLFPHARVRVMVLPIFFRTFGLPAWIFLGLWFVLQGFIGAQSGYVSEGDVAWAAHVAGFVAGMVLVLLLRPRGIGLFAQVGRQRATVAAPLRGSVPQVPRAAVTKPPRRPTVQR